MANYTDVELRNQIIQLYEKVNKQQDELSDILNQFELVIVETTSDLRIMNSYGAVDSIFKAAIKKFERGENLLKIVFKVTKNSRGLENGEIRSFEEMEYLEDTLNKFVEGNRKEIVLRVVGEKEDAEIFLLIWKLKRLDRTIKHYFKIIPSNAIIKAANDRNKKEINEIVKQSHDIYNLISDGIIILDLEQKIQFLNQSIKDNIILKQSNLLRNSNFENRFFKEIFITGTPDEIKFRIETNRKVINTKIPISYNTAISNTEFIFSVNPVFNEKKEIINLLIVIRPNKDISFTINEKKLELSKLIQIIRSLSEDKNQLKQRTFELENNQQWLMNNLKQTNDKINYYNNIFAKFPIPLSIQEEKNKTFLFVNNAFEKLFKANKNDVIGNTHFDIFPKEIVNLIETNTANISDSSNISTIYSDNLSINQVLIVDNENNKQIISIYQELSK